MFFILYCEHTLRVENSYNRIFCAKECTIVPLLFPLIGTVVSSLIPASLVLLGDIIQKHSEFVSWWTEGKYLLGNVALEDIFQRQLRSRSGFSNVTEFFFNSWIISLVILSPSWEENCKQRTSTDVYCMTNKRSLPFLLRKYLNWSTWKKTLR